MGVPDRQGDTYICPSPLPHAQPRDHVCCSPWIGRRARALCRESVSLRPVTHPTLVWEGPGAASLIRNPNPNPRDATPSLIPPTWLCDGSRLGACAHDAALMPPDAGSLRCGRHLPRGLRLTRGWRMEVTRGLPCMIIWEYHRGDTVLNVCPASLPAPRSPSPSPMTLYPSPSVLGTSADK
jgi:hypothetical protein